MKNLTKNPVRSVMDLLIETNGSTTTLEVKLQLRELGYNASQTDVSRLMNDIFNESDLYTFKANGTYRTYMFFEPDVLDERVDENYDWDDDDYDWDDDECVCDICDCEDEDFENDFDVEVSTGDVFDSILKGTSDNIQSAVDSFNQSVLDNNRQIPSNMTSGAMSDTSDANYDSSKPLPLGNYFRDIDVINSPEAQDDENVWVVRAKDGVYINTPILTFDSGLTSDKVRSRYTTIMRENKIHDLKIQDVRARRVRNVKAN